MDPLNLTSAPPTTTTHYENSNFEIFNVTNRQTIDPSARITTTDSSELRFQDGVYYVQTTSRSTIADRADIEAVISVTDRPATREDLIRAYRSVFPEAEPNDDAIWETIMGEAHQHDITLPGAAPVAQTQERQAEVAPSDAQRAAGQPVDTESVEEVNQVAVAAAAAGNRATAAICQTISERWGVELQDGSLQNDSVRELQERLAAAGYGDIVGSADGILGPNTERALIQYAIDNDLDLSDRAALLESLAGQETLTARATALEGDTRGATTTDAFLTSAKESANVEDPEDQVLDRIAALTEGQLNAETMAQINDIVAILGQSGNQLANIDISDLGNMNIAALHEAVTQEQGAAPSR